MAYGIRWQINFSSVAEKGYRVNILDEGWTGSVTQLTGSDDPFVIEENDDTDTFTPIRTKTGYINIVTDNINLVRNIIPMTGATRKVVALEWDENEEEWVEIFVGWVQPQLIDIDIWQGKTEIGIPIECCLSGLKYRMYKRTGFIYLNEFLADGFSNFNDFVFQCPALTNSDWQYTEDAFWLNNKFTSVLFTDETYYDILEAICIFFGWTCRTQGETVYFVANRNIDDTLNPNLYRINLQKLNDISGQASDPTSVAWNDEYLPSDGISSMNTKMVMQEGASQGIVRCDLDPYDETISPDEDAIKQAIHNNTLPQPAEYYNEEQEPGGDWIVTKYYTSFGPYTIGNVKIEGSNVYRQLLNDEDHYGNTDIALMYPVFNVLRTYKTEERDVYDPDSGTYDRVVLRTLDTYNGYLRMETTDTYVFTTGKLVVSLEASETIYGYQAQPSFAIGVGNQWYNPTTRQWESSFLQNTMRIYVNRGQKYEIPIGNVTDQKIIMRFYEGMAIGGWTVEYQAENTEAIDSSIKEIVHMKSTDKNFSLKKEIESKFALKENLIAMAKNFIFKPDLTPRTSLWTDINMDDTFNPLDRLATEVVEEMRNVGEILELDIRHSKVSGINPITKFYIEWFDATYYPICISRDLFNDRDTIKFMKRLNSSSSS